MELLSNYLTNRFQRVRNNGLFSDWLPTHKGVPQGTVLGPLLFLLYVNDIEVSSGSVGISQYADDTCLLASDKCPEQASSILSAEMSRVVTFFEQHRLNINVSKTSFLIFRKRHLNHRCESVSLLVNDTKISQVSSAKYLGVMLDQNLTFDAQVRQVLRKTACAIKVIYSIRDNFPRLTRLTIMNALVCSHFIYCAPLLTSITAQNLQSLERQINWALKASMYKSKYDSASRLRVCTNTLRVQDLVNLHTLLYLFKLFHNLLPAFSVHSFPGLLTSENPRTGQLTIVGNNPRSNVLRHSFLYYSIAQWNALPRDIRQISSVATFKCKLKEFLLRKHALHPHSRIIARVWSGFQIT